VDDEKYLLTYLLKYEVLRVEAIKFSFAGCNVVTEWKNLGIKGISEYSGSHVVLRRTFEQRN